MRRILILVGAVVWSVSAPVGISWADPTPEPEKLLSWHGNAGVGYVEDWTRESSPALDQMKPVLLGSLYLGTKYGPKGLALGGQIEWDVKKYDYGRRAHIALLYEF